jgi:hypothetical protein
MRSLRRERAVKIFQKLRVWWQRVWQPLPAGQPLDEKLRDRLDSFL